jgi:hypothetical protein
MIPAVAAASPVKSRYTTIELKSCKRLQRHLDRSSWMCPGLVGYPVYVADKGGHLFLAFGARAQSHRGASQTLRPRNTIFDDSNRRPTVEWRFVRRGGRDVPYATIVRYATSTPDGMGRALIVSKVMAGESCHVAYIDARSNPDAIVLARNIADHDARTFDCKQEPMHAGERGSSQL